MAAVDAKNIALSALVVGARGGDGGEAEVAGDPGRGAIERDTDFEGVVGCCPESQRNGLGVSGSVGGWRRDGEAGEEGCCGGDELHSGGLVLEL